jgi:spoIIIJ-associated protein
MKDHVFAGVDVAAAVSAASQALGVAAASLRYVVLEQGRAPGLGLAGMPARIAVLLDGGRATPDPVERDEPGTPHTATSTPLAMLERCVQQIIEAADLEVKLVVKEGRDGVSLGLEGRDASFFLQEDGEVLRSLEHVLLRVWLQAGDPRRLRVECEGSRELRDAELRSMARALAEAVRQSGQPQESAPLNAYERRLIHVELAGEAGLQTFSVGEGRDRRVTVALTGAEDAPAKA